MQAYDMRPFDMQSLDIDMSLVDPLDLGNHIFWPLPSDISASGMTAPDTFEEPHTLVGDPAPANSDMDLYPELAWKDSDNLWGNLDEDDKKRYRIVVQKTGWEQVLKLTKCLFLGSLWVGLHGNPFRVSAVETRRLITNSFLTSLRIDGKMYSQFVEHPCLCLAFLMLLVVILPFDQWSCIIPLSGGRSSAPVCALPHPCSNSSLTCRYS